MLRVSIQNLENQFTNIGSQLQSTIKTYPLIINAQALEDETDTSAIAQGLCNRIYRKVFSDKEIKPKINNAFQLEIIIENQIIPQIKQQLQKQYIALILEECKPNQVLITFCRKLTDVLHIAFITDQALDAPLRSFPPNQPNLLNAIQSWINEIE